MLPLIDYGIPDATAWLRSLRRLTAGLRRTPRTWASASVSVSCGSAARRAARTICCFSCTWFRRPEPLCGCEGCRSGLGGSCAHTTQDGLASKPATVTGLPCDLRQHHPRDRLFLSLFACEVGRRARFVQRTGSRVLLKHTLVLAVSVPTAGVSENLGDPHRITIILIAVIISCSTSNY